MGCCGNNVGVGMSGDAAFQNRKKKKHEKYRSIISPSEQSRCQVAEQTVYFSRTVLGLCCLAPPPHWTLSRCRRHDEIQHERPGWDASVEIRFKLHFFLLLSRLPEINLNSIWIRQKTSQSCCNLSWRGVSECVLQVLMSRIVVETFH